MRSPAIDAASAVTAFPDVPFNRLAGFRLVRADRDLVEVTMPPKRELIQEHGVVHGGMLAALADTAAVYLIHPYLGAQELMASIEFKVNFLKAAFPDRGYLVATATPVRVGRRVAVCESTVTQDGDVILKGLFTYMRFEARG